MPPRLALVALVLMASVSAPSESGDREQARAKEVAVKVESHARRNERAEAKPDLVRDRVDVGRARDGKVVIEQTGEASFYGGKFHGRRTASGDRFNEKGLSAAHPTLPLGSDAKVTNLDTGRSVKVEISDRGPYVKGRDIDLSRRAAEAIGLGKQGVAPVKIEATIPRAD